MATKRSAPDSSSNTNSSHKRHKSSTFNRSHPTAPANLKSKLGKNSYKKAHPVNELKSQIRDLRRLLERADKGEKGLPAIIRVEKERALRTAEEDLARAQAAKKRSEIIGRWHKVRFFERQKAERRLKKLRKEAKEAGDADEELEKRIADAQVDVNYAIYYPLEKDYVPLWPSRKGKKDGENDPAPEQDGGVEKEGDAELWQVVRKCMEDNMLQDLREGRLGGGSEAPEHASSGDERQVKRAATKQAQKGEKHNRAQRQRKVEEVSNEDVDEESQNSEDETGTGFFDL